MHFNTDENQKIIKYKDFRSLYPFMSVLNIIFKKLFYLSCWSTSYPVGHPTLLVFNNKHVNWKEPWDIVDDNGNRISGVIFLFNNNILFLYICNILVNNNI